MKLDEWVPGYHFFPTQYLITGGHHVQQLCGVWQSADIFRGLPYIQSFEFIDVVRLKHHRFIGVVPRGLCAYIAHQVSGGMHRRVEQHRFALHHRSQPRGVKPTQR